MYGEKSINRGCSLGRDTRSNKGALPNRGNMRTTGITATKYVYEQTTTLSLNRVSVNYTAENHSDISIVLGNPSSLFYSSSPNQEPAPINTRIANKIPSRRLRTCHPHHDGACFHYPTHGRHRQRPNSPDPEDPARHSVPCTPPAHRPHCPCR